MIEKQEKRYRRHRRIRAKIRGTSEKPRLFAFRSNNHIYVQLIDDDKGKIIVAVSDLELKKGPTSAKASAGKKKTKTDKAKEVGKLIAKEALEKKIEKAVFDRGGYKYHGRIKALAEGAREGGLKF